MPNRYYERRESATFDLATPGGIIVAVIMTVLPGAVVVVNLLAQNWTVWRIALTAGLVLFGVLFVGPLWVSWYRRQAAETQRIEAEAQAATAELIAMAREIEKKQLDLRIIEATRLLSSEQTETARQMAAYPCIEITTGARINWIVNGVSIPVWFAVDWWNEYRKLPDDQLPGQGTWNGYTDRDNRRMWSQAITTELIRSGKVRQADSHYPPRWITPTEQERMRALGEVISLWLALTAAGWVEEDDNEQ